MQFIKTFLFLSILVAIVGCARKTTDVIVKVERKKTNDLLFTLDSISTRKPDFVYTKWSTHFSDTAKSISFKTSIKILKDSAISALVTYARIPIYQSIVYKDSLKIVNKREKCYIERDLSYFKESFGVDFEYKNLEELILGLPIAYDTNQRYFQIHDPYEYIISSHRKTKIKRLDRKSKEDLVIKYFLNTDGSHLKATEIHSPSDTTTVFIDYLSRDFIDGYNIPKNVLIKISTPINIINIEISYDKLEINKPEEMIIVIPDGYEICD
jgi:hypothetical protein